MVRGLASRATRAQLLLVYALVDGEILSWMISVSFFFESYGRLIKHQTKVQSEYVSSVVVGRARNLWVAV